MPNSSDPTSPSRAFASLGEELYPAASDQTRGVRQSLAQIRSLTSDATEKLILSVLGRESEDRAQVRLGLRRFVEDTADVLRDVWMQLESDVPSDRTRDFLRARLGQLAREGGIEIQADALQAEHVHALGQRMGEAVFTVLQSLQVDDLVSQLADEIQWRLDRLDELSDQVRDTAEHMLDADADEMRRFAERLVELSEAIGKMREDWADTHRRVRQEEMDEGAIELF